MEVNKAQKKEIMALIYKKEEFLSKISQLTETEVALQTKLWQIMVELGNAHKLLAKSQTQMQELEVVKKGLESEKGGYKTQKTGMDQEYHKVTAEKNLLSKTCLKRE